MKLFKLFYLAALCMVVTMASCSGEDGERGPAGEDGDSITGPAGADGTSCWDLNGNGVGDAEEDINQDGDFNALDCQGTNGTNGTNGTACWDLNGNGVGDANEDSNLDGNFDAMDCQGTNGEDGQDGNANVVAHVLDISTLPDYNNIAISVNDGVVGDVDLDLANDITDYAFIFYLTGDFTGSNYYIPGSLFPDFDAYVVVRISPFDGAIALDFFRQSDDTEYTVNQGDIASITVVAIELTNTSKNAENVMAGLKAAGVDVRDYNAVATYFGL